MKNRWFGADVGRWNALKREWPPPHEPQREKASSPQPSPPVQEREKPPSASAVHGFKARTVLLSAKSLPLAPPGDPPGEECAGPLVPL